MTPKESDEQRRDALLLKLLKTPPKQRPKRARGKKSSKVHQSRASGR
jgi:hypothetical protein